MMHRLRLKDQAFEDKKRTCGAMVFVPWACSYGSCSFNGGTRTDPAPDRHPQHDEKAQ